MKIALKLQLCSGVKGHEENPDYRDSEPSDEHMTIAEVDPMEFESEDDPGFVSVLAGARSANRELRRLFPKGIGKFTQFDTLEVRIMDSDGKV